jgi:hypothetical protein
MSTTFGPQLIGETEKTLNALLRLFLEGSGLTESQWVTLRLADQLDGGVDANGLVDAVADRALMSNAADLVSELTRRGLLDEGRPTAAGREMTAAIQKTIAITTAPIWESLPDQDVAAATRVLNEIVTRARAVLASNPVAPRGTPRFRPR